MRIGDLMTQEVALTHPDETIQQAAARMAEADVGMLPVGEQDRLIGMLTDRDIAVRGAARGKGPKQARVRDIMTLGVEYCFDDEDADNVARRMGELRLRRL